MIEEINISPQSQPSQKVKASAEQPSFRPAFKDGQPWLNKLLANKTLVMVLGAVLIVGLGVLSGWLVSSRGAGSQNGSAGKAAQLNQGETPKKGEVYGQEDGNFTDYASGTIEEGGIDGEGTHKLIRQGGDSQTVYLFSSVLDLDAFIGRTVEIWGETFSAEKAGWLMDVGKLKVLD
jgi:hypothetical protein